MICCVDAVSCLSNHLRKNPAVWKHLPRIYMATHLTYWNHTINVYNQAHKIKLFYKCDPVSGRIYLFLPLGKLQFKRWATIQPYQLSAGPADCQHCHGASITSQTLKIIE